jgi:hypothetical protein
LKPDATYAIVPTTTIATKLVKNKSAAPPATDHIDVPKPKPLAQSGGTSEIPIDVPAAVVAVSEPGRKEAYTPAIAQKPAVIKSRTVGEVRAEISAFISWNGNMTVIIAAPLIAIMTLSVMRPAERRTRKGDPEASPIARPTIGPISGATSIAPITTAVLPTTRPSVAIPIDTKS